MKNLLEKKEKLNEWIDLIFGVNQEEDEENRNYYDEGSFINYENRDNLLNNQMVMEGTDFGLIPYKIFKSKFPVIKRDNIDNLKIYNHLMIENDHYVNDSNPLKCCICIGRTNLDKEYLDIYKTGNSVDIKKLKDNKKYCFYFVGDIFGNVTIYKKRIKRNDLTTTIKNQYFNIKNIIIKNNKKLLKTIGNKFNELTKNIINDEKEKKEEKSKKEEKKEEKNEKKKEENEDNICIAKIDTLSDDNTTKYIIYKKLYDHKKQIKYIDFNRRLNLFATYSLDGYINLYLFPSCKLINAIKVSNISGNAIFNKILLISNPFPMIYCSNESYIYILNINGNFISCHTLNNEEFDVHIDKNCGIVQDFLSKDKKEYSLPFINEIK